MMRGERDDSLTWKLTRIGVFDVRSYYNFLSSSLTDVFPRKIIWYVKVPKNVSFFSWTTTWGGILIIDNLVQRG